MAYKKLSWAKLQTEFIKLETFASELTFKHPSLSYWPNVTFIFMYLFSLCQICLFLNEKAAL